MNLPRRSGFALLAAVLVATAVAQPGRDAAALLNSQRIAQVFGSYGVEILEADDRVRVSSLYSEEAGSRTTRTFAIVSFDDGAGESLSREQEAIINGGSIGETLASFGWVVEKRHRYLGLLPSTSRVESLMRLASDTMLAVHIYDLHVERSGNSHDYATIVEIHHPGYLGLDDLFEIYGSTIASGKAASMLRLAWRKMNVSSLGRGDR
ncbi:MAG TPA: hypothetical protein VIV14_12640 [Gammaproteobacteria bacterium]